MLAPPCSACGSIGIQIEPATPEGPGAIATPRSRKNWRASGARSSEEGASETETEALLVGSAKSGAGMNVTETVTGWLERLPTVRSERKRAPVAPVTSRTTGMYFADETVGAR